MGSVITKNNRQIGNRNNLYDISFHPFLFETFEGSPVPIALDDIMGDSLPPFLSSGTPFGGDFARLSLSNRTAAGSETSIASTTLSRETYLHN